MLLLNKIIDILCVLCLCNAYKCVCIAYTSQHIFIYVFYTHTHTHTIYNIHIIVTVAVAVAYFIVCLTNNSIIHWTYNTFKMNSFRDNSTVELGDIFHYYCSFHSFFSSVFVFINFQLICQLNVLFFPHHFVCRISIEKVMNTTIKECTPENIS